MKKRSVALAQNNGDGTGRLAMMVSGPEAMVQEQLGTPDWQDGVVIDVPEDLAIEDYFVPDMTAPSVIERKPPPTTASEPPVPRKVTALQFITACAMLGHINEVEAEAWVAKNAIPAAAQQVIAALPQAEQFPARLRVLGMTEAVRQDPFLLFVLQVLGLTSAEADDLFRLATTL